MKILATAGLAVSVALIPPKALADQPQSSDTSQSNQPPITTGKPLPANPDGRDLAGPSQKSEVSGPTIVRLGSASSVERPDGNPEQAALRLLTLSETERSATDRIIAARALKFDRFVERNIPLLTKFGVADATGDKKDMAGLLVTAAVKLRGVLLDRPLRNQLFDSLGPENMAALRKLPIKYDDAIALEPTKDELKAGAMVDRNAAPTGKERFERLTAERLESVGREIKLAFDRAEYSGGLLYAYAMHGINVSPADEAKLRQYCQEFAERTKDSPTEADNQKLFFKFCSVLSVEHQVRAIRNFQGRAKPAPPGKSSERTNPANRAK